MKKLLTILLSICLLIPPLSMSLVSAEDTSTSESKSILNDVCQYAEELNDFFYFTFKLEWWLSDQRSALLMTIDYENILFSENPSVKYRITDDAGNQIKPYSSFTLSGATTRTSSTLLRLLLGDVNYSESLTSADAQIVLGYAVGSSTPSTLQAYLADYDGNGVINTTDARLILQNI